MRQVPGLLCVVSYSLLWQTWYTSFAKLHSRSSSTFCGQRQSYRKHCPLKGNLYERNSFLVVFSLFPSPLRERLSVSGKRLVFSRSLFAICYSNLLCSIREPCHLPRQGDSSTASHFNKLATVFTLQILGAELSCISRNSQDSNVFPSGRVLIHSIFLL